MGVSRMAAMFMRFAMAVQIILGIGFWTGHWSGLVNVHMAVGLLFVLALWVIAVQALTRAKGLAAFALLWGVVIVAFGMTQQRLLIGDLHWIVRVLHLAVGLAAMSIAERLVGSGRTPVPTTA